MYNIFAIHYLVYDIFVIHYLVYECQTLGFTEQGEGNQAPFSHTRRRWSRSYKSPRKQERGIFHNIEYWRRKTREAMRHFSYEKRVGPIIHWFPALGTRQDCRYLAQCPMNP